MSLTLSSISQSDVDSLNARWNSCFSARCIASSDPETIATDENSYQFGEAVKKIDDLRKEGKKICLFIGRNASEKLPSDCNESDPNEVWISADIQMRNLLSPNRIHLWIDCNQQEAIETLQGLFNKIVIDQSTTKALYNDFAKRFSILFSSQDSSLLFEAFHGMYLMGSQFAFDPNRYEITIPLREISMATRRERELFENWGKKSEEEKTKDLTEFFSEQSVPKTQSHPLFKQEFTKFLTKKAGIPHHSMIKTQFIMEGGLLFKSYLETRFHHVEYHSNEPFPYSTNYRNLQGKDSFFIVNNPK